MPERGRGKLKKFPRIKATYESTNVPGLFFAGTLAHSLDFRVSAGGFIHGFRYTARTLHRYLEVRNHGVSWPHVKIPVTDILAHVIQRINEAAGIYQMFQILGDVMILNKERTEVTYIEEFPLKMLHALEECSGLPAEEVIVVVFQYGANFSGPGKDVFREDRAVGDPEKAHKSNFLHPVYYHYETLPTEEQMNHLRPKEVLPRPTNIHHMVEDFLTMWDTPVSHIQPLRRFLENITGRDLRQFFAQTCAKFLLTYTSLPLFCEQYYMKGEVLQGTQTLLNFMTEKMLVS